jgi:uncharacterized protein (DUF4213/DUF364 family)
VGKELGGVKVRDEGANAEVIANCDVVIITGMALPNRTLPTLMRLAEEHNTATLICIS